MPGFLTDPLFWLAVTVWLSLLLIAWCLCAANTCAQRRPDASERERREALKRISGGDGWRKL